MTNKPIRACLCYPHTFAEIKAEAQKQNWTTIEAITNALGCGSGCGLCLPYLERMLRTGETAFAISPFPAEENARRGLSD